MVKKKSFFERLGLVESAEEEFNQEELLASLQAQSQAIEEENSYAVYANQSDAVDSAVLQGEDFLTIDEIYASHGLLDKERSIFKVEEFKKHLPENFPTDVLRQSIYGILTASGLTVEEVSQDAELRLNVLREHANITEGNTGSIVKQKEQEIRNLLEQIDTLKQDIIDRQEEQKLQSDIVNKEHSNVFQILSFITGGNKEG